MVSELMPWVAGLLVGGLVAAGWSRAATRKLRAEAETARQRALELEQETAAVRLVQETVVATGRANTLVEAGQNVLELICAYLGWPLATAWGVSRHRDRLINFFWFDQDPERYAAFRRATSAEPLLVGLGLPGRMTEHGQPEWVVDITRDVTIPTPAWARPGCPDGDGLPSCGSGSGRGGVRLLPA